MKGLSVRILLGGAFLALAVTGALELHSAGYGSTSEAPSFSKETKPDPAKAWFEKGLKALEAEDYKAALKAFKKSDRKKRDNPDTLNMIAYSFRKLGRLDEAFETYEKALALRPRFPKAREYLGEGHLQAALRELETLKSYGPEGEAEFKELFGAFKTALQKAEKAVSVD